MCTCLLQCLHTYHVWNSAYFTHGHMCISLPPSLQWKQHELVQDAEQAEHSWEEEITAKVDTSICMCTVTRFALGITYCHMRMNHLFLLAQSLPPLLLRIRLLKECRRSASTSEGHSLRSECMRFASNSLHYMHVYMLSFSCQSGAGCTPIKHPGIGAGEAGCCW